jgi:hypothetical protein
VSKWRKKLEDADMKKNIIIITTVLLTFGLVPCLLAQTNVPVSANVLTQLTVNVGSNVDFANVGQGTSPSVTPTDGTYSGINGGTPTVGHVTVTGSAGANILISWTEPLLLQVNSGANYYDKMDYNPTIVGDSTASQLNAFNITSGNQYTLEPGGVNAGKFDLWLGGTLTGYNSSNAKITTLSSSQSAGSYSGNLVVTISYN